MNDITIGLWCQFLSHPINRVETKGGQIQQEILLREKILTLGTVVTMRRTITLDAGLQGSNLYANGYNVYMKVTCDISNGGDWMTHTIKLSIACFTSFRPPTWIFISATKVSPLNTSLLVGVLSFNWKSILDISFQNSIFTHPWKVSDLITAFSSEKQFNWKLYNGSFTFIKLFSDCFSFTNCL